MVFPPQKLLFEHIESLGISREKIDGIRFREGTEYFFSVQSHGETVYRKHEFQDLYCAGFADCLLMRESCVCCKYARKERIGDLTIGDFHQLGAKIPFEFPDNKSISLILANTYKGEDYLAKCSEDLNLVTRTFEEAYEGNPQLRESSRRKSNYDKFVKLYQKYGFRRAARKTMRIRMIKNLILRVMRIVKK